MPASPPEEGAERSTRAEGPKVRFPPEESWREPPPVAEGWPFNGTNRPERSIGEESKRSPEEETVRFPEGSLTGVAIVTPFPERESTPPRPDFRTPGSAPWEIRSREPLARTEERDPPSAVTTGVVILRSDSAPVIPRERSPVPDETTPWEAEASMARNPSMRSEPSPRASCPAVMASVPAGATGAYPAGREDPVALSMRRIPEAVETETEALPPSPVIAAAWREREARRADPRAAPSWSASVE